MGHEVWVECQYAVIGFGSRWFESRSQIPGWSYLKSEVDAGMSAESIHLSLVHCDLCCPGHPSMLRLSRAADPVPCWHPHAHVGHAHPRNLLITNHVRGHSRHHGLQPTGWRSCPPLTSPLSAPSWCLFCLRAFTCPPVECSSPRRPHFLSIPPVTSLESRPECRPRNPVPLPCFPATWCGYLLVRLHP